MCFSCVRFEVWRMRCWKILALPCVAFYGMTTRWKLMQFDNFESIFGLWHHYLIWFQESKDCLCMLFDALVTVCVFCGTCKVGMLGRMKITWNWYHFAPHTFLATALTTWWCHKTQQVLIFLQRGRSTLAYQQRQEQFGTKSRLQSLPLLWCNLNRFGECGFTKKIGCTKSPGVSGPLKLCGSSLHWQRCPVQRGQWGSELEPSFSQCRWPAQLYPQSWMQKSSLDSCWRQHPNVKEGIFVEYIAVFQCCFKYLSIYVYCLRFHCFIDVRDCARSDYKIIDRLLKMLKGCGAIRDIRDYLWEAEWARLQFQEESWRHAAGREWCEDTQCYQHWLSPLEASW